MYSNCKQARIAVNLIKLKTAMKVALINRLTFSGLQNLWFRTAINALLASNKCLIAWQYLPFQPAIWHILENNGRATTFGCISASMD